ncbi:hypothetical protein CMI47_13510, partial [Candidatus Pacearchaeota archaeon]|nr:hypothetical protein [Candidatus Pacearchaeota archaeon]
MLLQDIFMLSNLTILEESKDRGTMKVRGVFQRAEEANNNKRIYPKSVMETQVGKLQPLISERRLCGELDHPSNDTVKLSNASHLITKLSMKGNEVIGEAEVLNTPAGMTAQALIKGGVQIGISSRGLGTLSEGEGDVKRVNEDFNLITFDLVADPSTRGAYPALAESRQMQLSESVAAVKSDLQQDLSEKVFMTMLRNEFDQKFKVDEDNPMDRGGLIALAGGIENLKKSAGVAGEYEKKRDTRLKKELAVAKKLHAGTNHARGETAIKLNEFISRLVNRVRFGKEGARLINRERVRQKINRMQQQGGQPQGAGGQAPVQSFRRSRPGPPTPQQQARTDVATKRIGQVGAARTRGEVAGVQQRGDIRRARRREVHRRRTDRFRQGGSYNPIAHVFRTGGGTIRRGLRTAYQSQAGQDARARMGALGREGLSGIRRGAAAVNRATREGPMHHDPSRGRITNTIRKIRRRRAEFGGAYGDATSVGERGRFGHQGGQGNQRLRRRRSGSSPIKTPTIINPKT